MATPGGRAQARLAAVAALLALYYVMALSAAAQKSMTFDELAHLTGGYTYWAFNDYRLHPENGNWPQRLAALPAVLSGAPFPSLAQPAWTGSNVYVLGDQFLYFSGNDAGALLARGRAVMALVGAALGALVFAWGTRLVSPLGGWVSLVLFVFSPTLLAHGPLVTSDVTAALFFTAAVGMLWTAMHRVTAATVAGSAVLVAGCLLSKVSGPILVPIVLAMLTVRLIDGRPIVVALRRTPIEYERRTRQLIVLLGVLAACGFVAWALVWASYGFRYSAFAAATTGKETFLGNAPDLPGVVGWFLSIARRFHLLPEAYIYAAAITVQYSAERAAFLNGQFSTSGWWWYFPYAFAVKTTIAGLIAGLLAIAALVVRWNGTETGTSWQQRAWASIYAGTPLLALVIIYFGFALTTNLNIGHRHLLPIYPALYILAGAAAFWMQPLFEARQTAQRHSGRRRRKPRAAGSEQHGASGWPRVTAFATLLVLGWHVVESLAIRPDYLAYFNQFAGGPSQGYRHLADSSLDWGQDLPALRRWLESQGLRGNQTEGVYLSYFGTARPEYYGVRATTLAGFVDHKPPQPPLPLGGGIYCISATVFDVIGHMFYRPEYETNYQAARKNASIFAEAAHDEQRLSALIAQTGEPYWQQLFAQFDQLRTGRLVAYLRRRKPHAMAGYSILIYVLSNAEVDEALNGPPPDGPPHAAR